MLRSLRARRRIASRRTTIARVTVSPVCSDRLAQYARHLRSQERGCVGFLEPPAPPLYRACENQESGTYAATLKGNNHAAPIHPPGGRPPPVPEWLPRLRGPCTMGERSGLRNLRGQLWRYGRALREHLAAADLTVRHARALAKLGEDY